MGIIYSYTNRNTGKKYIGQTIHPEQRKRNHLHEATVKGSDYYFHRSIRKHGWDAFDYEVLEEGIEQKDLNDRESFYIEKYNTIWPDGYNQCMANSLDETAIEKMRQTKIRKYAAMSEEERRACVEAMVQANTGAKRSEETRRKQSEAAKKHLENNYATCVTRGIRSDNVSGHKGVRWNKQSNKWVAYIQVHKEQIHLGSFLDKDDAIKARKEAEKKYHTPYIKKEGEYSPSK